MSMKVITADMILFYKSTLGFKRWRNYFFSLTSDGVMTRYKDQNEYRKDVNLVSLITKDQKVNLLKASILIGDDVIGLPDRPPMDLWMDGSLMMCIPVNATECWWLLFQDCRQLGDWMENIALIFKAHKVQNDFILRNRLCLPNQPETFCDLKNTLKYRTDRDNQTQYPCNPCNTPVPVKHVIIEDTRNQTIPFPTDARPIVVNPYQTPARNVIVEDCHVEIRSPPPPPCRPCTKVIIDQNIIIEPRPQTPTFQRSLHRFTSDQPRQQAPIMQQRSQTPTFQRNQSYTLGQPRQQQTAIIDPTRKYEFNRAFHQSDDLMFRRGHSAGYRRNNTAPCTEQTVISQEVPRNNQQYTVHTRRHSWDNNESQDNIYARVHEYSFEDNRESSEYRRLAEPRYKTYEDNQESDFKRTNLSDHKYQKYTRIYEDDPRYADYLQQANSGRANQNKYTEIPIKLSTGNLYPDLSSTERQLSSSSDGEQKGILKKSSTHTSSTRNYSSSSSSVTFAEPERIIQRSPGQRPYIDVLTTESTGNQNFRV